MNTTINYATLKQRLLANAIDIGIIFGITVILFLILISNSDNIRAVQATSFEWGFIIGIFFYMPIFDAYGGTIGKRTMKITPVRSSDLSEPTIFGSYKKYFFLFAPIVFAALIEVLVVLYVYMFGGEDMVRDLKGGYIEPSPRTIGMALRYVGILFITMLPFTLLLSKRKQTWNDWFANIIVKSNVPPKEKHIKIASIEIQEEVTNKRQGSFPKPRITIPKILYTNRIAFLIYILLAILIIMFTKHYLDIKRDEKHFEFKKQYELEVNY